ncbi:hybrid sensor histidine kinase/response regulator [Cupriavidus pinatubonensis]|uniref:histidine kinase n=1 Tax=Cupriavidus pinatubonensis TaxID=248026 RepID=A0ABM8XZU5_9BURK|nr:PAS domain-containing hybrid sensor histidine kinase/response regulator [Cupriavidus pinatubonensis]CAG9185984.1 Sensor histidine kinase RcsC [Cupriavidus pinatubonensis]
MLTAPTPITGLLAACLVLMAAWLLHWHRRLQTMGSQRDVLAAIIDAAPYPIVARDERGRFVAINVALENFLDIRRQTMLGKTMEDAGVPPNIVAAVASPIARARASGQRVDETLRVRDGAGDWHDLLFATQPLRLPDGTEAGTVSATIDITAQLAAEQAALEAKRVLDEIADALPVASFQLCAEPGGRYWFSYFSAKAERYRGWSAERLLAVVDGEYPSIHPEDRLKMADALHQSAAAQSAAQFELRILVDGETRWLRLFVGAPAREPSGQLRWSGYAGDATDEHRQLEALAASRAAAEGAAQAKARFLATMTHEIRTPLAAVIGALELLRGSPMSAQQASEVSLADNAARLLMEILDGILDYSRLEAGQLTLESLPLDLRALVESVMQVHRPAVAAKQLAFAFEADARVAVALLGDPTRLKEIVLNLIGNAVKFTAQGGITVRLDLLEDMEEHQRVSLSVADTGVGIDAGQQEQLFAPFSQADSSISRRFGGSGLGLAICRRLAERMGGTLTLQSQPGAGTTIVLCVTLPVALSPALQGVTGPAEPPPPVEPLDVRKAILVVEDHLPFQVIMRRQLEMLGQDCTVASGGEAALEQLRQQRFALVLTDCQMPGMNGFELSSRIRASGPGANADVPIVALTASAGAEVARQCHDAGMDACLAKPVRMDDLRACIARWAR